MYVITFYSFKGGVGRTMALVNVAAELVRQGRKVLVVDFDLEAPGLETYEHLHPPKPPKERPGIIEYVTEYRRSNAVPNLLDYIHETKPIGKRGGRLWVMPAGRRDRAYRSALVNLDWQRLYKDEDGLLLFEETKKGWEEELKPDYVFIDSRTGDTDVLGICTRQLPDSVVLMFTPNEQNLAGLENVCRDIRREETEGLKKKIRLHFVAANVPDLDDEKGILRRQIQAFRKRLGFKDLSGVIRRYESLTLLDQSVFTLDRPHSRLARYYRRRLLRKLLKDNLADREGAMIFLEDYQERIETRELGGAATDEANKSDEGQMTTTGAQPNAIDNKGLRLTFTTHVDGDARVTDDTGNEVGGDDKNCLHEIAQRFNEDVGVLKKVAGCFLREEMYKSARNVFDRIVQVEPNSGDPFFARALCKINLGQVDDAADDFLACFRVLSLGPSRPFLKDLQRRGMRQECLRRFCTIAPVSKLPKLAEMVEGEEIKGVDVGIVVDYLCRREEGVPIAAHFLRNEIANARSVDSRTLLLARCWKEVGRLHEAGRLEEKGVHSVLALGLAHLGECGEMPELLSKQAIAALEQSESEDRAIFFHCWGLEAVALLLWGAGKTAEAIEYLNEATQRAQCETEEVFSLWRLRDVSVGQYLDDCQLWRRLFQGEPLRPAFLGPPTP